MKQQELGIKLVELRKGKGLTQEDLVAKCNINVRTLQRIEAGEVIPRSYTLQAILTALEVDYTAFVAQLNFESKVQDVLKLELKPKRHPFKSIIGQWSFTGYIVLIFVFGFLVKFGMPSYFYIIPVLFIFLIKPNDPKLEINQLSD